MALRAVGDLIALDGHGLDNSRRLLDVLMKKAEEGRGSVCAGIPIVTEGGFISK